MHDWEEHQKSNPHSAMGSPHSAMEIAFLLFFPVTREVALLGPPRLKFRQSQRHGASLLHKNFSNFHRLRALTAY